MLDHRADFTAAGSTFLTVYTAKRLQMGLAVFSCCRCKTSDINLRRCPSIPILANEFQQRITNGLLIAGNVGAVWALLNRVQLRQYCEKSRQLRILEDGRKPPRVVVEAEFPVVISNELVNEAFRFIEGQSRPKSDQPCKRRDPSFTRRKGSPRRAGEAEFSLTDRIAKQHYVGFCQSTTADPGKFVRQSRDRVP